MIAAGKRNRLVAIIKPSASVTQNSYGEVTSGTTTVASVWAAIEPLSVREINIGKGFATTVSHKITLPYRSDLKTSWRITYGSRSWNINGVLNPDELNSDTVIYATEVASG